MSRTRPEVLRDALGHFELMLAHARLGLGDQLVIDAVCMRLSAGLEALASLSPAERVELFGDNWPLMWGMRNRVAHGYVLIDATIIRETIAEDIPGILRSIRSDLESSS